MSGSRAEQLALRRQALVAQSQAQREQLQRDLQAIAVSVGPGALARRLWARVQAQPSLILVAVAGLVAARRYGVRRVASRALLVWRGWQVLRRWLARSPS